MSKEIEPAMKSKPRKGYRFLENLKEGVPFVTESGLEGTIINKNEGSVLCLFTKTRDTDSEDDSYYLGKKRIAPLTNVKKKGS